jgi:biopolymer transport protein ExbD
MKFQRRRMNAEVPAVAMGDIAFNLLIFFVILAQAQDDSHLKWEPAVSPDVQEAGHPRASITVDVNHKVYLNGQPIGLSQIESAVNERLANAPLAERRVQLKIHREAMASLYVPIISAVGRTGAKVFHILEEEKEKKK